ncbi:hypothetical protein POM88_026067 [Heracleum sosnowskyi]|uniref:DNA helicase n=1 Tax=Heracleum sosnowskyi TaxID=360622 RepID=A0AAD8MPK6_9APIA|nr:hypothetical protein POM88_026067 [Heracleum sosnowskyi]
MVSRINPLFEKHIQARIFNLKTSTTMRNLNPSGKPCLDVLCVDISLNQPIVVDRGRISEPTTCGKQECLAKNSMTLVHSRCRCCKDFARAVSRARAPSVYLCRPWRFRYYHNITSNTLVVLEAMASQSYVHWFPCNTIQKL